MKTKESIKGRGGLKPADTPAARRQPHFWRMLCPTCRGERWLVEWRHGEGVLLTCPYGHQHHLGEITVGTGK